MKMFSKYSKNIDQVNIDDFKIDYEIRKRDVKYPRLEIKQNSLYLIIPNHIENYKKIINNNKKWIAKKYKRINKVLEDNTELYENLIIFGTPIKIINSDSDSKLTNDKIYFDTKNIPQLSDFLRNILKDKLEKIANDYSKKMGVNFNRIYIRKQKTKWASCSSKKNLTFNLKSVSLPEKLIKYLVMHELAHLKERKHNKNFVSIIENEFTDYEKLEDDLKTYWIILNNNYWWKLLSD